MTVTSDEKLKVITTIPPLYSFTKNITGDLADVENLLPPGAGPHDYSFSPGDAKKVADARLLIINGLGLEGWLDRLVTSAGSKDLTVLDTSKGVEAVNGNPHIWLSPKNAVIQVKNITEALINADPVNAGSYSKRSEAYIRQLEQLDREISNDTARWGKKDYIAESPAYAYLARDYALNQTAVIQESHDKGNTPGQIIDIMNKSRDSGAVAIFAEPGPLSKAVKMIAGELELKIYRIDTMETGELSAEWYIEKVKANHLVMKMAFDEYY
jgi:zinc/manganese transport system substrate-binding protein